MPGVLGQSENHRVLPTHRTREGLRPSPGTAPNVRAGHIVALRCAAMRCVAIQRMSRRLYASIAFLRSPSGLLPRPAPSGRSCAVMRSSAKWAGRDVNRHMWVGGRGGRTLSRKYLGLGYAAVGCYVCSPFFLGLPNVCLRVRVRRSSKHVVAISAQTPEASLDI